MWHILAYSLAISHAHTMACSLALFHTLGLFQGMLHVISHTYKLGFLGFFKGYVPAFVRLGPQTILTFVFLEQLRQKFGILKPIVAN